MHSFTYGKKQFSVIQFRLIFFLNEVCEECCLYPQLFYNYVREFQFVIANLSYKNTKGTSSNKIPNLFRIFFEFISSAPLLDLLENFL